MMRTGVVRRPDAWRGVCDRGCPWRGEWRAVQRDAAEDLTLHQIDAHGGRSTRPEYPLT